MLLFGLEYPFELPLLELPLEELVDLFGLEYPDDLDGEDVPLDERPEELLPEERLDEPPDEEPLTKNPDNKMTRANFRLRICFENGAGSGIRTHTGF